MGITGPFLFPFWKPSQDRVQAILSELDADSFSYNGALVGATSRGAAALEPLKQEGFKIDHNRVCVGSGEAVFQRTRKAVKGWRHFQLGWASVNPQTPIVEQGRIAVVARSFGLVWTLNPLQIVYVDDSNKPSPQASTKPHVELAPLRESREGGGESVRVGRRHERARVRPAERKRDSEEEGVSGTDRGKGRFAYGHGTLKGHLLSGEERFLVEWKDDDSVWYDILAFSRPGHFVAAATYPVARFYQRQFAKQSIRAVKAAAMETRESRPGR